MINKISSEINAPRRRPDQSLGGNAQAIVRPDGVPIRTSEVVAGHDHDLTATRHGHVLGVLYWAASQLNLPALADGGYEGVGQGVHIPFKRPDDGKALVVDHLAYKRAAAGAARPR